MQFNSVMPLDTPTSAQTCQCSTSNYNIHALLSTLLGTPAHLQIHAFI